MPYRKILIVQWQNMPVCKQEFVKNVGKIPFCVGCRRIIYFTFLAFLPSFLPSFPPFLLDYHTPGIIPQLKDPSTPPPTQTHPSPLGQREKKKKKTRMWKIYHAGLGGFYDLEMRGGKKEDELS